MDKKKEVSFTKTMKRLLDYASGDKLNVLIVLIFSITSTIFAIIGPKIMGNATTEIFNGLISKIRDGGQGIDFSKLLKIIFILTILYIISTVFSYAQWCSPENII